MTNPTVSVNSEVSHEVEVTSGVLTRALRAGPLINRMPDLAVSNDTEVIAEVLKTAEILMIFKVHT